MDVVCEIGSAIEPVAASLALSVRCLLFTGYCFCYCFSGCCYFCVAFNALNGIMRSLSTYRNAISTSVSQRQRCLSVCLGAAAALLTLASLCIYYSLSLSLYLSTSAFVSLIARVILTANKQCILLLHSQL